MEENNQKNNSQESQGWEIVRQLNDLTAKNSSGQKTSFACRKLLADYFKLDIVKPSKLHSAILSCGVRMATLFPDFHFVPFLDMWGLENLRPEDSERIKIKKASAFQKTSEGPSLVERMTKAYAYSLMFHPEEHLETELEQMLKPFLNKKGYRIEEKEGLLQLTSYAIGTRVFQKEDGNIKVVFAALLTPSGDEVVTEVHAMTQFTGLRYEDIINRLFKVILRTSAHGNLTVEAAIESKENKEEHFATSVGYVEHIDGRHHHIHVYDNESRHLVAKYGLTNSVKEGDYVRFIPVIPKEGNFKMAIISSVLKNGQEAFGYRRAKVTFVNEEQGYCAWQLLPEEDGKVRPIVESGAAEAQEPATTGYISKSTYQKVMGKTDGFKLPKDMYEIQIITFLKRGKDGKKRPVVVDFK